MLIADVKVSAPNVKKDSEYEGDACQLLCHCYWKWISWSRVLEKPLITHLTKKFSSFCENRKYFTMFTRDRYWTLS